MLKKLHLETPFVWRLTIFIIGLVVMSCAAPPAEEATSQSPPVPSRPSRPNVILMMSDDQGWGDVEYPQQRAPGDAFPGHSEVKTPNLRAMAAEGLQFHRMYSGGSVCSPTRASFVIGRAPRRTGIDWAYNGLLRNLELTIAELAKTQGYMTGHFGKWHLGDLERAPRGSGAEVDHCPEGRCQGLNGGEFYSAPWHHGYDRSFASPQALPTFEPMRRDPTGLLPSEGNFHGAPYWTGHGEYVDIDSEELRGDSSAILVRETLQFIEDATAAGRPFFAVIWFHPPHTPHRLHPETLEEFYTAEERDEMNDYERRYYSGITAMDQEIGRLRSQLRSRGIEGETLVAFTSDNGMSGSVRVDDPSEGTGRLRGHKGELWEGGVRVPGIIEWPGQIAPGETHTPMITSDYLPTLLDIWGVEMPDARPLDGESMTEVLFGDRSAKRSHRIEWADCGDSTTNRGPDEPRDCDSRPAGGRGMVQRVGGERSIIDERYKLISETSGREWELYDLIEDPRETTPVATSADIASKSAEIQKLFASLLEDITVWFEVESAASRAGADYDTRIASADGVELLGDTDDETVPDDLSARRLTAGDRPELVVERQFVTLEEDLTVDSGGAPTTYDQNNLPPGASIAGGTVVHSYLLHFNPEAKTELAGTTITFEDPILGVSGGGRSLQSSDFLAFADPDFGEGPERRTAVRAGAAGQSGEGADSWKIHDDGMTITIALEAGGMDAGGYQDADQVRIVTQASLQRQ